MDLVFDLTLEIVVLNDFIANQTRFHRIFLTRGGQRGKSDIFHDNTEVSVHCLGTQNQGSVRHDQTELKYEKSKGPILSIDNTLEVMIEPDKKKRSEDLTTGFDGDDAGRERGNGGAHARLGFMKMISLEFSWKENAVFSV
ncbi:hypothetical protein BLNAU_3488 [Blattamonas nauphoetae]|uniref:Uncharacterized protein n=1 Tax=Blattamonas nauphoetae TaxID=2049346 RepID=A0ABQ9YD46_9EUKA|nr:hypothetical protein BLNAU_3488 [Blattamonas nauphoetae]